MNYIENNNQGIIALLKRNKQYEYNAIDSSYCVLQDYNKEIENGEYFKWIESTKLDFQQMKQDFIEVYNSKDQKQIDDYLIWERPNIYIDFDSKLLVNFYHDRFFEEMIPLNWKSNSAKNIEEFLAYIPNELKYW